VSIVDSIRYYLITQEYSWKKFFAFRAQSLLWLFYNAFIGFLSVIAITVIYSVSSGFAGWNYYQMLILSSTLGMVLSSIWYNLNSWEISHSMRHGGLDSYMIRPYGLATVMLSMGGAYTELGGFATNLAIFAYSAWILHLSILYIIIFFSVVAIGTYALLMFFLMFSVLSYHLIKSSRFINNLLATLGMVGNYPLSIFGNIIMLLFTLLIPIGIAVYYPAELLFGEINITLSLAIIAFSLTVAFISYKLFYFLMRYYTSGGG